MMFRGIDITAITHHHQQKIKTTVLICSSKRPHYPNYSNDCAASTRCRNQPQKAGKEEVAIGARGEIEVDDREREELMLTFSLKN